jgi:hypothetical protein
MWKLLVTNFVFIVPRHQLLFMHELPLQVFYFLIETAHAATRSSHCHQLLEILLMKQPGFTLQ